MTTTLYDITEDCARLLAALEAIDAMDMPEEDRKAAHDALEAEYWGAEGDLAVKAEGYVKVARGMEARAAVRKAEADRLAALAKSDKGQADRMKARLQEKLDLLGYDTKHPLQTALYRLNVQGNGGVRKLEIKDEDALRSQRPDLFKAETVYTCDTDKVRAEIEQWEGREQSAFALAAEREEEYIPSPPPFDGVTLHSRGTRLVIK